LITLRDWLRWAVSRFNEAGLHFGHGTDNAWDEAVWILLATLHLPRDTLEPFLDARLTHGERHGPAGTPAAARGPSPAGGLPAERGLARRVPLPCRSARHRAALLLRRTAGRRLRALDRRCRRPWSALDLCTGSGCLAIVMAHAFPNAAVDAIDISPEALEVARRNIADYGLDDRVRAIESDLFATVKKQALRPDHLQPALCHGAAMDALPAEYRHEPALALAAGADGLDVVRRILAQAHKYLKPGGVLAIEVGHNQDLVTEAFPDLPAVWLDTAARRRQGFRRDARGPADADGAENAMQLATFNNISGIEGACGGFCSCATCHVYVESAHSLPSPTAEEENMLGGTAAKRGKNSRLACQIRITPALDGLVLRIPDRQ
jgi:ribosomal protein L3 glutamine methyltransferase